MKKTAILAAIALGSAGPSISPAAAAEKPPLDRVIDCASLHGWLSGELEIPAGDREIAKNEAAWFLNQALALSPAARDATTNKYKQWVSERKKKAAMAFLGSDPEAEADLFQDARTEIASCSKVGGALLGK